MDLENRTRELEKKLKELEDQAFNQKLINTFTNMLMIFIGISFGILFKKVGV